jgi:hypothetical protein
VRESGGLFRDDTNATVSDASLRALANTEGPLTYTCAPPGSGVRMGINRDGDLFLDGLDNCPGVINDDQTDTDMNGVGDACEASLLADSDSDGVADVSDNCPSDPNPGQEDFDMDGQGDVCDSDDDNDGLADLVETDTGVFLSPTNTGTSPFNADTDGDGVDDGVEVAAGTDPTDANSFPVSVPALPGSGLGLLALLLGAAGVLSVHRKRGQLAVLLLTLGVGLAVGEARASEFSLNSGETLEVAAASLGTEEPVILRLSLPKPSRDSAPLPARVYAPDGRMVETLAAVVGADRRTATLELTPAWLTPGRYVVEVRTTEHTHFPLRRYVLEIR